jgi:hypothetical protein
MPYRGLFSDTEQKPNPKDVSPFTPALENQLIYGVKIRRSRHCCTTPHRSYGAEFLCPVPRRSGSMDGMSWREYEKGLL